MRRIAAFIANMISAGGCASAGVAEAGALVPPTSVGGAPLADNFIRSEKKGFFRTIGKQHRQNA